MPVHFSSEQLEHAALALRAIPEGVEKAAVLALNRASVAARTAGLVRLTATYTAKRATILHTMRTFKASRSDLVAGFSSEGSRIPLTSFDFRPHGPTVRRESFTVSVRKGSGQKSIGHGFVNRVKGGRLMALQREGKARYPLQGLFGPAAPQMLGEEGVREVIETRAQEILDTRMDHEIGRLIEKGMK